MRCLGKRAAAAVALTVSVLLAVTLFGLRRLPPPGPRIAFAEEEVNVGVVAKGAVVEAEVRFANRGDEVLLIREVRGGCKCINVRSFPRSVAPGEKGAIGLTFIQTAGPGAAFRDSVAVVCNTTPPVSILPVIGTGAPTVVARPSSLSLAELEPGEAYEASFDLVSLGGMSFDILSAETDLPNGQAQWAGLAPAADRPGTVDPRLVPARPEYRVTLRGIAPGGGATAGRVIVVTTHLHMPTIEVQVRGSAGKAFQAHPSVVGFGRVRRGTVVSRRIRLAVGDSHGGSVVCSERTRAPCERRPSGPPFTAVMGPTGR